MEDNPGASIAMLVTVGGAVAPVLYTLNQKQPPYLAFFVSKESKRNVIEQILPGLQYRPVDYEFIMTDSPQNLLACYEKLQEKLAELLPQWNVSARDVAVDYTAGTKTMSVAAVLATIESSSQYFYVGSAGPKGRDRDGIGVVLDGREYICFDENPWEALAVVERKEIAMIFNLGRFAEARERMLHLAQVARPEKRVVFKTIAALIEGYELWDRFDYRRASDRLHEAVKSLELYLAGRDDPLQSCMETVRSNLSFLASLSRKKKNKGEIRQYHRLDTLDLIANAGRRASLEGKYDDAAARLYSALECLARYRLLDEYGIKNNDVQWSRLGQILTEDQLAQYSDRYAENEPIRLGLQASYLLLAHLDDELGKRYLAREKEVERVLLVRKQSRLAHGTVPVDRDTCLEMQELVFDFAQIEEGELPAFPRLVL